ncbi:hypothetical protein [Flavobacterium aestivum]|uniref:hypothetical protein n=1 Tax=Flavobacterium aestivum TaxID=3003257 RepID=UPI002482CB27|nr:hypothetical protein [Flavobacterium aestivum]
MGLTYRIKSVDGDTSFQHVTLRILDIEEGDYFDMSGNYLGSTENSTKRIFITGRDTARIPYSHGTLPKEFYDKDVSFTGIGNIVNLEAAKKYGTIITDLSYVTRMNVAEKIYNHYYQEAGYSLNELKYKTITDADNLNRHLSKAEIKRRTDGWTDGAREQLEGTELGITRVGGYAKYSEYLKDLEAEISIDYGRIGLNFDTGYDIMSVCAHEHKHLVDCINDVKNKTHINSERRAYTHQTLVDRNWKFVSFRFKAGQYHYGMAQANMYPDDFKKAFGKLEDYKGFIEQIESKNITL